MRYFGKCWFSNIAITLLVLTVSSTASSFQIHNDEYNFTVVIPDKFEAFDALAVHSGKTLQFVKKNLLYSFLWTPDSESSSYIYLLIERSSRIMSVDFGDDKELTGGATVSVLKRAWKKNDITLHRTVSKYYPNIPQTVTLNAILLLKEGPIQFKLSGSLSEEENMMSIIRTLLYNLEAEAAMSNTSYLLIALSILGVGAFIRFKEG